jgi:glycosyltransferase involved in cell wall biosynthesis
MRQFKLGIVANEFFDEELGRMGGFGWAARRVAELLREHAPHVEVVFLSGELRATAGRAEMMVDGTRLVLRARSVLEHVRRVRAERLDLLLSIDYRPNYRPICWALPRTPMIVWARDPRPPEDVTRVHGLRLPGSQNIQPLGTFQPDCSSLGTIVRCAPLTGRPLALASTSPHLQSKLECMIRMKVGRLRMLPNPIAPLRGEARKSERPSVAFLARLDPYKRPWLVIELARRFPDVQFQMAGKAHFRGEGAWNPSDLPPNARMLGHLAEAEKRRLLSQAWVLVNSSIHEGLAVSFLEALACETPILACVDPDGLVSRFGIFAGQFGGDGMAGLPALEPGLRRLLSDAGTRTALGRAGRRWMERTHTPRHFLCAFDRLSGSLLAARCPTPRRRGRRDGPRGESARG